MSATRAVFQSNNNKKDKVPAPHEAATRGIVKICAHKNVIQRVLSAMKEKQSKLLRRKTTRLGRKEQRDAILY